MVRRNFAAGGAIPPGWNLEAVRFSNRDQPPLPESFIDRTAVNLLADGVVGDLVSSRGWPVRDQKDRETCTAFAVVAAEELARFRVAPHKEFEAFSEEHLYAAIRAIDARTAGVDLTDEQLANLEVTGATYLAQAHKALAQSGLCSSSEMPYQDDQKGAYFVGNVPQSAAMDAQARRLSETDLMHNIIDLKAGGVPPDETVWIHKIETSVADVILRQLEKGIPVVASFALLHPATWFQDTAKDWGEVIYSRKLDDEAGEPFGGHTVCLVGYLPAEPDDTSSGGWFQFRNSFGERFARHWKDDPYYPKAMAAGYGHISAADLSTYCWEYMCRRDISLPTG